MILKPCTGFPLHLSKTPTWHYLLLCLIFHILSLSCSATLVFFLFLKCTNLTSASGPWHLLFPFLEVLFSLPSQLVVFLHSGLSFNVISSEMLFVTTLVNM